MSLKLVNGAVIANFMWEHYLPIWHYSALTFDNGTPFVIMLVTELLEDYEVCYVKSSPYYPQGSGVEPTSKILLLILGRTVCAEPKK